MIGENNVFFFVLIKQTVIDRNAYFKITFKLLPFYNLSVTGRNLKNGILVLTVVVYMNMIDALDIEYIYIVT